MTKKKFFFDSKLKMSTLDEYALPNEISEIERNRTLLGGTTAKEIATRFGSSVFDRATESGYVGAFKKMLQFEEAAQSHFLVQFNTKGIQLGRNRESESDREFCIKNDVSKKNIFDTC